jgi:CO/xanthine dehydrogenase Mo-binding subunit
VDSILVELPYSRGPHGAKGVGEPSLIPIAAAIANAAAFACGHRFTHIPITPERLLTALEDAAAA